jgi:hypothetical protein
MGEDSVEVAPDAHLTFYSTTRTGRPHIQINTG